MAKETPAHPDDKKVVPENENPTAKQTTQDKKPPEISADKPAAVKRPEKATRREGRPPKAPVKEEEPKPPKPEKTSEQKEAPRSGKQEQIVYLNLSELHAFKNHPFQVRDDEEMRAMVESVKDKTLAV